jgi:hypothetical protein
MKFSMKQTMAVASTVGLLVAPSVSFAAFQALPGQPIAGVAGGSNLAGAIQFIVSALLTLAALVAAVYLILGGIKYITSSGDEDKAGEAKQQILFALIGLVVIGLSVVAVNFIISIIPQNP